MGGLLHRAGKRAKGLATVLAVAVVSCSNGGSAGALPLVQRPGLVLIDPAPRQLELAAMPPELRAALCSAGGDLEVPEPAIRLKTPARGGTDSAAQPFAWLLMRGSAAAFALDDATARARTVRALDRWARADALARLSSQDLAAIYSLNRALLPAIAAYALTRDAPELDAAARARIERWLERGVRRSAGMVRRIPVERAAARNNHAYLAASVRMAWGAMAGAEEDFAAGLAAYRQALGEMRGDGSLPLETARGARALWYQRHAIASLVAMAEMAAVQGVDLYGLEQDGRSLHTAIGFLLDAIDDPGLVAAYARENVQPGPSADWRRQDLGFLVTRGFGRHYMAWVEAYAARFPERPESRRLLALMAAREPAWRPMIDEYLGANASCLFARAPAVGLAGLGPAEARAPLVPFDAEEP